MKMMKRLYLLLLCLCPMWAQAQSEDEIRKALDAFDYEVPIKQVTPASGDVVLTPLRAQALKAMNRYLEALKEWNSLLTPDSMDTKVLAELAECYRQVSRSNLAAQCYAKAVTLNPENKFFRQQHIRTLLTSENYEEAIGAALGWLEKDSLSATAYKFLGMAYQGLGKEDPEAFSNAYSAYYTAYSLDSLDAQTVAHLGAICNDSKEYSDALDFTETYRLTDTLNIDVNRQNAKAYCMMKDYEKAVERYESLKRMGDRSFTTLYYLGISHYGDEWFYGAQENLLLAYKKNPNDVNLLYYLGKSCSRTSWKKDGVEYLKKALEITVPEDSVLLHLYEGLAECYGRWHEADPYEEIEVLKKTYALNKKYIIFFKIAEVYERQKDYANAIYYYEKYMAMVPEDKRVILDSDGKPDEKAISWYQAASRKVEKMKEESFFRDGVK